MCYNCGKEGHFSQKYPQLGQESLHDSRNMVSVSSINSILKVHQDGLEVRTVETEVGVVNSRYSHYLSAISEDFVDYRESQAITMTPANGRKLPVVGVGSVSQEYLIRKADSYTRVRDLLLTDVYHVPKMVESQLISLDKLLSSRYQQNLRADVTGERILVYSGKVVNIQE